jgi:hypothetical protein
MNHHVFEPPIIWKCNDPSSITLLTRPPP